MLVHPSLKLGVAMAVLFFVLKKRSLIIWYYTKCERVKTLSINLLLTLTHLRLLEVKAR